MSFRIIWLIPCPNLTVGSSQTVIYVWITINECHLFHTHIFVIVLKHASRMLIFMSLWKTSARPKLVSRTIHHCKESLRCTIWTNDVWENKIRYIRNSCWVENQTHWKSSICHWEVFCDNIIEWQSKRLTDMCSKLKWMTFIMPLKYFRTL